MYAEVINTTEDSRKFMFQQCPQKTRACDLAGSCLLELPWGGEQWKSVSLFFPQGFCNCFHISACEKLGEKKGERENLLGNCSHINFALKCSHNRVFYGKITLYMEDNI